tara:strand:- start:208 stop:612 length:405 start_codon:yes stop_codon:yes gene_type:complete
MSITNPTIVTVSESITDITVTGQETIAVDITQSDVNVEVNNFVLPNQSIDAQNTVVAPYGTITATNVQDALKQLADQDFRSTSTPTGTNVSEGDTWYDTDDNIMKVYREVSTGVFAWTNLVVADTDDLLDAGAF